MKFGVTVTFLRRMPGSGGLPEAGRLQTDKIGLEGSKSKTNKATRRKKKQKRRSKHTYNDHINPY
jgi:hypothetical protein